MNSKLFINISLAVLVFIAVAAVAAIIFFGIQQQSISLPSEMNVPISVPAPTSSLPEIVKGFKKFTSEQELRDYLSASESVGSFYGPAVSIQRAMPGDAVLKESIGSVLPTAGISAGVAGGGFSPERVSETNVQVAGIDEPDIVKTDGKNIYTSSQFRHFTGIPSLRGIAMEEIGAYSYKQQTKIINAFPPTDLAEKSAIDKTGNLLLENNILTIFSGQKIYGYDVSDPSSPQEKWSIELKDRAQFAQARLYDGKIYLVTQNNLDRRKPCPVEPFIIKGEAIIIPCNGIYHPEMIVPVNVTYNVATINPKTGELLPGISFLGSYDSTVYMSKNALYAAYFYSGDMIEFLFGFISKNKDLFPNDVTDRIGKLRGYDISQEAKMVEWQKIMEEFENSVSDDDRLKMENEMENRMDSYFAEHKRDLSKTNIVKIGLADFRIDAVGTVPGALLNQFSMDEYQNYLRVAVTVGQGEFSGFGNSQDDENDVYVLDSGMKIVGEVKGMGLDERIYSARFIEDKGYVVTFRQTDPFYVFDFSDPKNPKLKGELKIPGYSSYLHPINKDKIVGVGKEGSTVKISLFDVTDPSNPKEAAKYTLDEYWSDVINTHHAFLMDAKHEIFFMPGNKGGYVFSYQGDELKLMKAISNIQAQRALYLDDYLYIVGSDKIVVLNETNWERVNELNLGE